MSSDKASSDDYWPDAATSRTFAQLLAAAALQLLPAAQMVAAGATFRGFFSKIITHQPPFPEFLASLEEMMRRLIKQRVTLRVTETLVSNAIQRLQYSEQWMLAERLSGSDEEMTTLCTIDELSFSNWLSNPVLVPLEELPLFSIDELEVEEQEGGFLLFFSGFVASSKKELAVERKRREAAARADHRLLGKRLALWESIREEQQVVWWPRGHQLLAAWMELCRASTPLSRFLRVSGEHTALQSCCELRRELRALSRKIASSSLYADRSYVQKRAIQGWAVRFLGEEPLGDDLFWGLCLQSRETVEVTLLRVDQKSWREELLSSLQRIEKIAKMVRLQGEWVLVSSSQEKRMPSALRCESELLSTGLLTRLEMAPEVISHLFGDETADLRCCYMVVDSWGQRWPLSAVTLRLGDQTRKGGNRGRQASGSFLVEAQSDNRQNSSSQNSRASGREQSDRESSDGWELEVNHFLSLERWVALVVEGNSRALPLSIAPEQLLLIVSSSIREESSFVAFVDQLQQQAWRLLVRLEDEGVGRGKRTDRKSDRRSDRLSGNRVEAHRLTQWSEGARGESTLARQGVLAEDAALNGVPLIASCHLSEEHPPRVVAELRSGGELLGKKLSLDALAELLQKQRSY